MCMYMCTTDSTDHCALSTQTGHHTQHTHSNVDDNSCIEGAIIGGILGGAGGAAASRGPDMAWAIPLGVVGGSLVGCQVDGG